MSATAIAASALQPRPSISATRTKQSPGKAGEIKTLRIYPAIGICRVGGSPKWFFAPEIPGMPAEDDSAYKDGSALIKKQVQRFRIYAFDKDENVVGEITADNAEITWGVHLANTKAAWYEFFNPLDNGDLAPGIPGKRRNNSFKGSKEREKMLVVDAGLVNISGINTNSLGGEVKYACQGSFMQSTTVKLGELRTDSKGRLLVFPGDGQSISPTNKKITSFADNEEWIDDWCDGPVLASVRLKADQRTLNAKSAWVASAGPDFAPEITPLVTMFDVVQNLNYKQGWEDENSEVSFRRDIYPILHRLDLMRWVSESAHLHTGWADLGPLHEESYIQKLSNNSRATSKERNNIFSKIRKPPKATDIPGSESDHKNTSNLVPWMLGDGVNYPKSPLYMFNITETQYEKLKQWAKGNFINDFSVSKEEKIKTFDDIPLTEQPNALTRAALEACSGGGFHPGVELTYNLRHAQMYERFYDTTSDSYRIALGKRPSLIQDLGESLTPTVFYQGLQDVPPPIGKQSPGDLTRWMGIPWQCDAFSCQAVDTNVDFPTAVWWPAQIPIDVLTEKFYNLANDRRLSQEQRRIFASQRKRWSRRVAGVGYHANQSYWDGLENMIALWQRMGIVVRRSPKIKDDDFDVDLSGDFFVETGRGVIELPSPADQRRQQSST
jgi:hypothetical protein